MIRKLAGALQVATLELSIPGNMARQDEVGALCPAQPSALCCAGAPPAKTPRHCAGGCCVRCVGGRGEMPGEEGLSMTPHPPLPPPTHSCCAAAARAARRWADGGATAHSAGAHAGPGSRGRQAVRAVVEMASRRAAGRQRRAGAGEPRGARDGQGGAGALAGAVPDVEPPLHPPIPVHVAGDGPWRHAPRHIRGVHDAEGLPQKVRKVRQERGAAGGCAAGAAARAQHLGTGADAQAPAAHLHCVPPGVVLRC